MKIKKRTASDFLALALYAFAGFGLEIVLSMLLPTVLGVKSSDYTTFHHVTHWVLTCLLWGSMTAFLLHFSKKKYDLNLMGQRDSISSKRWVVSIGIAVIAIVITTIVCKGFKPVIEYKALITSIFQNIYYLFESALILLTIAFGQKFGDMITKKENLPWGGLVLALTWGLVHILLQDFNTGLYTVLMSILYGTVYIVLNRNTKYAYAFIAVMFIL
ncbi:hypothetical protein [Scatolibacter rhodanostii]|uniref:hypothetical protein n=1 Tax=Scatolibacter rhodanostii TaxID=2014781 RepID=UPI000C07AE88|nr:hypothetical protein [Scatolibacter rhodanostii]